VLGGIGGFGGLFELPGGMRSPVLVSGADGVGTKLRLAITLNQHSSIGIDLVAMCVNDILVCGAEPLWFLDYYGTGKLDVERASQVVEGIAEGCVQAGAALLGGETAEMPGMYEGDDYDLAGFAVGVVEKESIIDGSTVAAGDSIIGLASSGPHSNGYSLINRLLQDEDLNQPFDGRTLASSLMEPTRIYVKSVLATLDQHTLKAMAHITGGGLTENLPRVLPQDTVAVIDRNAWITPPIFEWLRQSGNISESEMLRTFNCGIGMALVVEQQMADDIINTLTALGETATLIGKIEAAESTSAPEVHYR